MQHLLLACRSLLVHRQNLYDSRIQIHDSKYLAAGAEFSQITSFLPLAALGESSNARSAQFFGTIA
jgi:hypothetical protein